MSYFSNFKRVSKSKASFQIADLDLSIVNSIRRISIQEIPTLALDFDITGYVHNDSLVIHKNTGVFHNEFLMHRISLVPFHFSLDEIDSFDENAYIFKLQVKNTKTDSHVDVTTKDIMIFDVVKNQKMDPEFHRRILPPNHITKDYILLTKLKPGEEIDLEFKLSKKTAESHSRWCPVSQCTHSFISGEGNSILEKQRNYKRNVHDEPNEFMFHIQSECGMKPEEIFQRAIELLIQKTESFITALETNDPKITIDVSNSTPDFYTMIIDNEDHTLVNMLQSCIYNDSIRDSIDKRLEYIGYYQPHPLHKSMAMKLKVSEGTDVRSFLTEKVKIIHSYLQTILTEWRNFSLSK